MCSLPICEHARFFVITLFTLWQWYDKNPWSITLVTDVRKTNGNLLNCLISCNLWRMEEGGLHAYVYREWKMQIIPLVPDKLEGPTTCLVFFGILIDTTCMDTFLPAEKLEELLGELQSWSYSEKCRQTQLCLPHYSCWLHIPLLPYWLKHYSKDAPSSDHNECGSSPGCCTVVKVPSCLDWPHNNTDTHWSRSPGLELFRDAGVEMFPDCLPVPSDRQNIFSPVSTNIQLEKYYLRMLSG